MVKRHIEELAAWDGSRSLAKQNKAPDHCEQLSIGIGACDVYVWVLSGQCGRSFSAMHKDFVSVTIHGKREHWIRGSLFELALKPSGVIDYFNCCTFRALLYGL